ncbi:MAG TPA: glycosyltransferase [Tepidisphaeraceae bacterium]|jgi:glycosyltransferase involved in cell wall biosynthesis|nr:glycosyltransferase [Tepidisphaeraceae bacterium]
MAWLDSPAHVSGSSLPQSPPRDARPQRLRVLFIHPAFPNQFTALGAELGKRAGFDCYGMVHHVMSRDAASAGGMRHFVFEPEGQATPDGYAFTNPFESGVRNARGIARSLRLIKHAYPFDAVVGHAGFGSTLYLRSLIDAAIISYAEFPGYQCASGRAEFPVDPDVRLVGHACEALIYGSMAQSDLCVVPSRHARQFYPPALQPMIRVQPEGFQMDPITRGGASERESLGLPKEGQLVGFFARTLEAVRGFDVFVEVARSLHQSDPSLHFVVIGDDQSIYGSEMRYLGGKTFMDHTCRRLGVPMSLLHWRRTMPYERFRRHLACLDLAVLPTFEGAANWSIFEAMVAGLPIIASNRCFIPEIMRDGVEGILLDPGDYAQFVSAARDLLCHREKAAALGRAARLRASRDFSVSRAADGYAQIILDAVALRRQAAGQTLIADRSASGKFSGTELDSGRGA